MCANASKGPRKQQLQCYDCCSTTHTQSCTSLHADEAYKFNPYLHWLCRTARTTSSVLLSSILMSPTLSTSTALRRVGMENNQRIHVKHCAVNCEKTSDTEIMKISAKKERNKNKHGFQLAKTTYWSKRAACVMVASSSSNTQATDPQTSSTLFHANRKPQNAKTFLSMHQTGTIHTAGPHVVGFLSKSLAVPARST